jgi:hypothetical protein
MTLLDKNQILAADDLPFRDVDVPEWGGVARVRTMTGGERDAFEASIYDTDGTGVKLNRTDFRAKVLSKVIVDEKGERLFTDKEISVLSGKSAKAIQRLFDVAQEINGISKAEQDAIEKK